MAQIVINVPDGQRARVMGALAKAYGIDPSLPNTERNEAVRMKLAEHVRNLVVSVEESEAHQQALAAVPVPADLGLS